MRLLVFVFVPAFVFADDLDQEMGSILFYPAPLCCSRLLHRLIKEGMSADPVPDVRALRERVLASSSLLPVAFRLLARANVVVVKVPSSCVLASMFPLMFRGADAHNGVIATFLATLPGYFTGVTRGLMPAALASLVPPSAASSSDPPSLLALTVVSHVRDTQPAPPFDSFLAFGDLISELMRMRMPSAEARFVPLFNRDWRLAYPILPRIFRCVTSPAEVRQHLNTLAVALRVPFDSFSESTVRGVCISVSHLVSELEVELPLTANPPPDEVIATLVRLVRRDRSDSTATLSSGADSARSTHADEGGYSKLLALPSFADLYAQVVALNTSGFQASLAISLALSHPHPAALIVMITSKTLPQPGWSSVIGAMRQKTAWPNVFDKALAVDSDGKAAHDWGVMLPVDAKGTSTIVQNLVTGKLHLITDWWSALSKWVSLYVGTHVLLLPEYAATSDPIDFWLSASRMRLVSPAMYAIFSVIAHGQSRSVSGSFREWYELHIARVTRIMHLPHSTPAYAATVADRRAAVSMLFKEHDEAFATMIVRPFHEAVRPIFLDPQRACYKSFLALDSELSLLQAQIALAVKGRASYQEAWGHRNGVTSGYHTAIAHPMRGCGPLRPAS